jgi:hypothetical protein
MSVCKKIYINKVIRSSEAASFPKITGRQALKDLQNEMKKSRGLKNSK